ncbi:disease resistance protein RPV1-like isoform X2 [Diospyros lotus]|uniref:disease resistance protein RPV1-like isoform X2 n=1 Tax=Diospyros lotus TaxID=55363 RepID=UPI00225B347C|nr:disease resistance protein RPV1-like isoform X2 [Diospyros lotus]
MGASSSTCSSFMSTNDGAKYDLFVSFSGQDIRDSFRSHFCKALSRENIHFFVDDKLKRGDEIWPALSRALEESRISVVIFSKDYPSSKLCLHELVKILECKKTNEQIVIPVFYQVNPSDVRSFGDAFINHENISEDEKQLWRAALTEASNLPGFDSSKIRPESKLIDEIIKDISDKLKDISPSSNPKGLIGIDSRIERVKSLLCIGKSDYEVVGIWGMGGIGKTTIAEAVFNQISGQFEGNCFIANVREESKRCGGLVHLRKKVLSQILEEEYVDFGTPNISQFMKSRLKRKKVLIVLDDVNTLNQLQTLAKQLDGFGPGSRIIITTRDKRLLRNCGVNKIYEVEAFNNHEARKLFCKYAFKQDNPHKDLMVFVDKVVSYAKGNPLALKVMGASLYQKTIQDWESALNKLNKVSDPDIQNLLKLSYDGLNKEEKEIFLDIACFFKGSGRDIVTRILDGCYFAAEFGLSVLIDKSLITISSLDTINMHDLLQELGHELVRQESFSQPGKRSRLHNQKDVCLVLRRNMGTEAVKSIFLNMSEMKGMHINSPIFENIWNLRFLKFYDVPNYISKVHCPNHLPDGMRYLHWDGYPSKALPSSFNSEKLVELHLCGSKLKQLWDGAMDVPNLRRLDLSGSQHLTRIPEFSNAPCLECVNLQSCKNLLDSGSSFQHLEGLRLLSLYFCEKFRSFPKLAGNIENLYLLGAAIEEVPSSIESLTKLSTLDLSNCAMLKQISPNIFKLKSLRSLFFGGCSNLEIFPEIPETLESLKELDLSDTAIKELPLSIENLIRLSKLHMRWCKSLETLPSSICNLRSLAYLDITNCSKLNKLPENLGNLKSLVYLFAFGTTICRLPSSLTFLEKLEGLDCSGLRGLTLPPKLGLLHSLTQLNLKDCNVIEVPEDIGCLSSLGELDLSGNDFESLPKSIKQLSRLRWLYLNNCEMLQSLTELPSGLLHMEAVNCKQLQSLPDASYFAESVIACGSYGGRLNFMFTYCMNLDQKLLSKVLKESLLIIQSQKEFIEKVHVNVTYSGTEVEAVV